MSMLEFISIRRSLSVWGLSLSIACLQVVGAAAEPASYLIDQIADDAMEDHNLAGISIAVAQGQIVTHAKGYGKADLQHDVDAKPNTVFRIGSVTKQFTAAATLQLVEQGLLGLDDDMRTYIPEFDTGGRVVTVRHLLNHTSGIKNVTEIPHAMMPSSVDVTQADMIKWISAEPFDFEPGNQFKYNNSGYWLLGVIIERVSGQSYSEYITNNVFPAANMTTSYYDSYSEVIANRATGYERRAGEFIHAAVNSPTRPFASGALLSTVTDLIKWPHNLFGNQVISAQSVTMMITPTVLNNGQTIQYGFGLGLAPYQGEEKVAHSGEIIGYQAYLAYYPDEELAIAILTNTQKGFGPSPLPDVEKEIADLFLN